MSELRTALQSAVAANFDQRVPTMQESREYLGSLANILNDAGLSTRVHENKSEDFVGITIRVPRTKMRGLNFWIYGANGYGPGNISCSGSHEDFSGQGVWCDRDQFVSKRLAFWICNYAPENVINKFYPDRVPLAFQLLPLNPS